MENINKDADTFEKVLNFLNVNEDQIESIYSGKDHECRCGCKGKYFEPESKSYNRILNAVKRVFINHTVRQDEIEAEYYHLNKKVEWVNIPDGDPYNDHCYCIYFKH